MVNPSSLLQTLSLMMLLVQALMKAETVTAAALACLAATLTKLPSAAASGWSSL